MSFLIATIGITSMFLAGYDDRRRAAGWALGLINQFIWIGYALATTQYGFIIGAVVYGAVMIRNLRRMYRIRQATVDDPSRKRPV